MSVQNINGRTQRKTTAGCSSRPVWFSSNSHKHVRILKHGQLTYFECEYKMATRQLKESPNTYTLTMIVSKEKTPQKTFSH